MSTADILSLVSLISYILAGICLVLAAFFWFFFKIPSVIGDLSGRTAKKSIEKMRQANMRSGNKSYRASATNAARGKLTDTMQHSSKLKKGKTPEEKPAADETGRPETGVLSENKAGAYVDEKTDFLDDGETTGNLLDEEATGRLVDEEATMALNVEATPAKRTGGKKLTMINEVMLIHTDEVIS